MSHAKGGYMLQHCQRLWAFKVRETEGSERSHMGFLLFAAHAKKSLSVMAHSFSIHFCHLFTWRLTLLLRQNGSCMLIATKHTWGTACHPERTDAETEIFPLPPPALSHAMPMLHVSPGICFSLFLPYCQVITLEYMDIYTITKCLWILYLVERLISCCLSSAWQTFISPIFSEQPSSLYKKATKQVMFHIYYHMPTEFSLHATCMFLPLLHTIISVSLSLPEEWWLIWTRDEREKLMRHRDLVGAQGRKGLSTWEWQSQPIGTFLAAWKRLLCQRRGEYI